MEGKIASFGGIDIQISAGGKEITATTISFKSNDAGGSLSLLTALGDVEVKPEDVAGKEIVIEFKNEYGAIRKKMVCKVGKYEGFTFSCSVNEIVSSKLLKFALESVVDFEEE